MSHPLYNPYVSGNQSSSQGQYGHPTVPPERDSQTTSSHLGPGSNFSSGVSSATPANSGGTIPSLLSPPMTYISEQRRPGLDKEIEGSVDMHISRAREEARHQPVGQDPRFTGTQTARFASSSTGGVSYPMPSTSQGQRHSDFESGSSSLDWLQDYKRATEDDSSRFYSTSASSSFPGSDGSRFNASSGRERDMQSIPGLGDYDYPGPDKPAAPTESSRPKYTSESAANILLHFGLEKEDLEYLMSFPDDQITPDNLPFILRQIRIQKAKKGPTADQSKPYPEPQPTTSMSSSRGAGMHLDQVSSAVLQPSKVIDYGHTSKYTGGVVDEMGRTSDSRENSGGSGSMFQTNPYSSGSHKSGTSVPSRDHWGSGSGLSSSYSSMQSSATPPSSDPTKRLKTQPDQTSQTTFSFPLPKKDTDARLFPPEIPSPLLTKESKPENQPKTEPSGTLVRGGNTSRPGILRLDGHDKSSSKNQSSRKGQGLKVAEQIKKQQMQPKQSEPQHKQLVQQPKQSGQQPRQPVQQTRQSGQQPRQPGQQPKQLGQPPKQPVQQPMQPVQQQPVRQQPVQQQPVRQQLVQQQPVRQQQQPVLQMGQPLQPQGFPAPRPVPPPSFIPSSSSTSHAILPPAFIGVPRPVVIPPPLPPPVPGVMNFLHMQMPSSSNQRVATGEVPRGLPSASMMHDYAAASPKIFPHTCTLCNKECSQMKDWISHQNTSIHLENCKLLRKRYPQWDGEVPSVPRAPASDAKPSPSSSAQTYQNRHQRSGREIPSRSRSSRSRSRSYSPVRHHGSESRRKRRSSRSRSRSYSPRRSYGSESRREKRSRSRSPYSSRYTRRSRSKSPRYDRRHRSRSRSHERRSSPRRRDEKRRERRSSSERSSPHRKRSSSTEMLAKKLLQTTAVQSLSSQSDLETVVKTLAPALLAELAKMKSSSSSSAASSSSSNAAKKSTAKKAKPSLQKSEASSSTKPKVVKSLPPTMVKLHGVRTSLSHGDVVAAVEQFGKTKSVVLFRSKVEAVVCFENAEDAEKLRGLKSIEVKGMPVTIVREEKAAPKKPLLPTPAKDPTKPPEQKSLNPAVVSTQSTKSTNAGKASSLPSAADEPKTGKLVTEEKVLVSKARDQPAKKTTGKETAEGAVKVLGSKKAGDSGKGNPEEPSETPPPSTAGSWETEQEDAVTSQKEASLPVSVAAWPSRAAATNTSPAAAPALTVGEQMEKLLSVNSLRFCKKSKCMSPKFRNKLLFLSNLPLHSCYTEQDVADLLIPFGFRYLNDYIHVIPQTRMAFAIMPSVKTLQNVLKADGDKCLVLKGSQLQPKVMVDGIITMEPLCFYRSLMKLVRFQQDNDGTRMIFIKNISASEARDLRKALTEITPVRNYLPLLNKVFIEFHSNYDADRFGFWFSRLKQVHSYKLQRMKIPRGPITQLPSDGVPGRRDAVAGATIPTTRCGVAEAPFWLTMRTRPFLFPTMNPCFIIPDHVTLSSWKDFGEARIERSAEPTVMLTNLPVELYSWEEDLVELLRGYFPDLHPELHSVAVLTLQKRAFVFFSSWEECCVFAQNLVRSPPSLRHGKLGVHFVLERMDRDAAEEVMYRNLMKWSNAHVPELESLEDRLLSVEISETTVDLVILVMHVVSSVASFISFLPLANRVLIEMSEPSGVTKVVESVSQHPLTATEAWNKVGRIESVRSRYQRRAVRSSPSNSGSESITAAPADVEMKDSEEEPADEVSMDSKNSTKDVETIEVKMNEEEPRSEVSMDSRIPPGNVEEVEVKTDQKKPDSEVFVDSRIPPKDVEEEMETSENKPRSELSLDSKNSPQDVEKSEQKPSTEVTVDSRIPPKDVEEEVKKGEEKPASEVSMDSKNSQDVEKSEKKPSTEATVDSKIPPKDVENEEEKKNEEKQATEVTVEKEVKTNEKKPRSEVTVEKEVKTNEKKPRSEVTVDSKIPPENMEKVDMKTNENKPRSEVSIDSRIPPENVEKAEDKKSEEKLSAEVTVDSRIPPKDAEEEMETSENKPRSELSLDSRIPPGNMEKEVKNSEEKPSDEVTMDSNNSPKDAETVEVKMNEEKPRSEVSMDSKIPPEDVEKEVKKSENKPRSELSLDSKNSPKDVEKSEKKPSAEATVDSRIPPKDVEKIEVKTNKQKPSAEATMDSRVPPENMETEVKKSEEKPSDEVTIDSNNSPKDVETVEVKMNEEKPRSEVTVDSRIPPEDVEKEVKKSEKKPSTEVSVDSNNSTKDVEKSEKKPSAEATVDARIPPEDVEEEMDTSENKPRSELSLDSRIPPKNMEKEVRNSEEKPSDEVTIDSNNSPKDAETIEVKMNEEKPRSEATVDSRVPPENMGFAAVKDEASAAAAPVWSADGNTVAAASSSDPSAGSEVKTQEAELPPITEDVFRVIAAAVRQHRLALRGTPSRDREVQSSSRNSTSSRSVKNKDTAREKDPTDFTANVDSSDFLSFEEQSFNLEDFVTVDEIVDEDQSSSSWRRTSRDGRGPESSDAAKQTSSRSSKDSKTSASSSSSSSSSLSKPAKASGRSGSSSSSKSASPKRHQDSWESSRSHMKPSAGRSSAQPPASSGHRAQPGGTESPAGASQSSPSGCRRAKTAAGSHQRSREEEKAGESAAAKCDQQVSAESAAAKTVESETETEASAEMLPPAQRQDSELTSPTLSLQNDLKNEELRELKMSKERRKEEADKHTEEQEEEEEEEDYQILDSVEEQTDEQTTQENPDEAQSEQRPDDGGRQVLDRVEDEGGARPEEGNASVPVLESISEDQEAAAEDHQRLTEAKQEKNRSGAADGSDKSAAEDSSDQNQDSGSRKSLRSRGRRTRDKETPSEESCKASRDAAGSSDGQEKPPEGRDHKDASTDVCQRGTFEILDSVEDQSRTEGDEQKPPADTEEDLFQVIDSVEDQPETESESNTKERRTRRGEAAAKRDQRATRRTPRTRTSQSQDNEKSPQKADRTARKQETGTTDSAAGKDKKEDEEETLKKTEDSVDGASASERSGRRRSTRGNKEEKKSLTEASENPDGEEEITYEILDSVEDEPAVRTRSTRGRSQRTSRKEASNPTKDDTRTRRTPARDSQKANQEKAAAAERTPTKKSGTGEEEATYEILDSVEDDQPPAGGKPRRGRPKKGVKTAKKPKKAAEQEEEEGEGATYQVLDSVGDETVEDQRHTEEPKSPRKSTVGEDDGRKTKESSAWTINEEEEEPMYQIVDSLEDDPEEQTNTEESDGRTMERSWTKDGDPAAETGEVEAAGSSAAEAVEENLQQTAQLHPAAAENQEESPEPEQAGTSLNLDEVSDEEEDYPDDDGAEEEEPKKQRAAVAVTTGTEADGRQPPDEEGGDGDGRRPEITEGELQELVTLDEICEEEEGKAELSVPEPRPLGQESQSQASSNPQAADEEEEKTSKCVKRKHEDEDDEDSTVLEQSVNFVTVDEVGDAEDEEEEEEETRTPRTRGRAQKRSRQSAAIKASRGKTERAAGGGSEEPPIQRTELEAAGGAQEEAASAGQQLEGRLEGRSRDDNKRRKQLNGPEAKKPRCSAAGEFSLPPFSSSPLGVEFVVPKSGFFCELCSVFYLNEISAKETHCSSQRHYHNLEKHYQKLKQKVSGSEKPESCS